MTRYIITVDRSRIDQGLPNTIRVEDRAEGTVSLTSHAMLEGSVTVIEGGPRQDGARVWIEADRVVYVGPRYDA